MPKYTNRLKLKSHYENVPQSWVICKLADVCYFESGYAFSSDDYSRSGTPLVRISNIIDSKISLESCVYINSECDKRFHVKKGDLLIAMSGATTGKMGVYDSNETAFLNQRVGNIKIINENVLLNDYRNIFMYSQIDNILELAYGGAQPNISANIICSLPIPIPSIKEQKRIIMAVGKWFSLIDTLETSKEDLQTSIAQAKSKILNLAIHGKLVPQDANDEPASELLKRINPKFVPCDNAHYENVPFKVPKNWLWLSHNAILDISGGSQPAKSYFKPKEEEGYIRLYQIRDYGETPVPVYIPRELASKTTQKGDILLARYGGSLGKVFIAEEGAYNVAMAKVIFKYNGLINKEYAYFYYLSSLYQDKLKSISRTAQAGFNSTDFEDLFFPLPPIAEQERIVAAINQYYCILDNISANL